MTEHSSGSLFFHKRDCLFKGPACRPGQREAAAAALVLRLFLLAPHLSRAGLETPAPPWLGWEECKEGFLCLRLDQTVKGGRNIHSPSFPNFRCLGREGSNRQR